MTEKRMHLEDWLDDLCVRFIINLPHEDLSSPARICFQIEEAQWFYEDFIRPLDPTFPAMSLRSFCLRIFQHCPILSETSIDDAVRAFEEFLQYKTRVPVRGAIMLNSAMDSVVLVKGWKKGASWSFPRGKINKDEDDLDCAIREVYEETGYDIKAAGLVPEDRKVKYIDITMREQQMRLFVFRNVPMDTHFEPRTRKEISKIQWYSISDLPSSKKKRQQPSRPIADAAVNVNKFYMVAPFLEHLRKWIVQQRKTDIQQAPNNTYLPSFGDDVQTEEEQLSSVETFAQVHRPKPDVVPTIQNKRTDEGTAEILRMINVQPPGGPTLNFEGNNARKTSASNNSGDALLALLRSGPPGTAVQTSHQTVLPNTPLDLNTPMPLIPGHYPPRPPHLTNLPPPPIFHPFPPSNFTPFHGQQSQGFYRQSNLPVFQQGPTQVADFPRVYQNSPSIGQGQQLQHPQPLPPQVQRAVFAGGNAHGPAVATLMDQPKQQNFTSNIQSYPQFPNIHGPMIPQVTMQPPPKLTSHSLALLNHFKNQDQVSSSGAGGGDFALRRFTEENTMPVANMPESTVDQPLHQKSQLSEAVEWTSNVTSQVPPELPMRAIPDDTHRSSLLNMFKSSNAIKPSELDSATIQQPPPPPLIKESPISDHKPISAAPIFSAADAKLVDVEDDNIIVASQQSASFRPASILTRPTQNGSNKTSLIPSHSGRPSASNGQQEVADGQKDASLAPAGAQVPKPFQPKILKRPQQNNTQTQDSKATPSLSALPNFAVQPMLDRANTQSQDHKQALLSLFGKSPAPAGIQSGTTLQTLTPNLSRENSHDQLAKSRVGSLASAGGELLTGQGRRESQTPISPADKGFLLDYLDKVTRSIQ